MSTQSPSNRTALRTFAVLFLAALVLTYCLPDIRRLWQPEGDFGYQTNFDNIVTSVDPHSPADRAGLMVGDRIDLASTNRNYRSLVTSGPGSSLPGQRVIVAIRRGAAKRYIAMVSEPEPMDIATKVLILGREFAMLLFVGIGAALVLLSPSVTTWAFYVYCLGLNGAPYSVAAYFFNPPWDTAQFVGYVSISRAAGYVGLAVFAAFFLHEGTGGWRSMVYRLSPVALVILWGLYAYVYLATSWFGWPAEGVYHKLLFFQDFLVLVALYALVETYVLSRGIDRQRIRWVILGFGVALMARILNGIIFDFNPPYWLYASLFLISAIVPLTVAYAVIRHRVMDVSFVVNRAIVYGVLTTLLVGTFALIDWLFIDKLKLARLGTVAEMGVAVAGGFWFNGLHRRVDSLIDATFFRQRHRAEVQLARSAAALPLAPTPTAVAHFLVDEPVRSTLLASAALFRRGPDGVYSREESIGWDTGNIAKLDHADDPLLMLAQAESGPLSLFDHPWRTQGVPSGPAHPVLALPIIVRRDLAAIVFYGSHIHGEPLDPDEVKAISRLAPGAAAAYDHLEAEAMRNKNESLQSENETLRAQLAEARIQTA